MRRDNLRVAIGTMLLDNRNDWISVSELAYSTGASSRQIGSALSQIDGIDLDTEQEEWGKKIKLNADDDETERIWVFLMNWRYHRGDVRGIILECIPYSGWISLRDLSEDTSIQQVDVARTLSYMKGISSMGTGKQIMYKRGDA